MRPHRLRVTAFGAFAATEQVTFDDLEGLFLLHGVTGAGKRLAGTCLAVQQEQALEVVERDLLGRGERAEGGHPQAVRAHQRSPPSLTALCLAAANAASRSS